MSDPAWVEHAIWWQIYPLGFVGAFPADPVPTADERVRATVYTSGEHCPMCAAAHAWVGLGRIVYAASTAQLVSWQQVWGVTASPVAPLPISTIAPGIQIDGPAPELAEEMKAMYETAFRA